MTESLWLRLTRWAGGISPDSKSKFSGKRFKDSIIKITKGNKQGSVSPLLMNVINDGNIIESQEKNRNVNGPIVELKK